MCFIKRNCLNCDHSALWDGDIVCVYNMKLLLCDVSRGVPKEQAENVLCKWRLCPHYRRANKFTRKLNRKILTKIINNDGNKHKD